tara:strand:- start:7800 stop:9695 length:1896 start_codon:yes stop_codon:yes gene_type:complete
MWSPSEESILSSNWRRYTNFLYQTKKLKFDSYDKMHKWSINNLGVFWESILQFFQIKLHSDYITPFIESKNKKMYESKWFEGAKLNYSEYLFSKATSLRPAIKYKNETSELIEISWRNLKSKTKVIQDFLIKNGVSIGDRVAAYCDNSPETIAAFLATNSLGAIWSSCSTDFGIESVKDRFIQIKPKILFCTEKYTYKGKIYNNKNKVESLKENLDTLKAYSSLENFVNKESDSINDIIFKPVSFSDPIWILYSSGTTGKPKAITHSVGGILLEHLKALSLHQNVKVGDNFFWYTTTGWMMWNYALGSLLCGGCLCIYQGSSTYPDINTLWRFAKSAEINHFGSGARFLSEQAKVNSKNIRQIGLSKIRTIGSTGSPLNKISFKKLNSILPNAQIISLSGGTDICSAFVGGHPQMSVNAGEIQCKMLGVSLEIWDLNKNPLINSPGELVITAPLPSMPIYFWNDLKYRIYEKSYFSKFQNVWTHGDWITLTKNEGLIIHGRSDATLNRNGIRIGTAEIYNLLDQIDKIQDSLIIHLIKGEKERLILFLKNTYVNLEIDLIKKIIREKCSPHHVPDLIFSVPDIPYTISGKKLEIPIKKIFSGENFEEVVNFDSLKNPDALNWFIENKSTKI